MKAIVSTISLLACFVFNASIALAQQHDFKAIIDRNQSTELDLILKAVEAKDFSDWDFTGLNDFGDLYYVIEEFGSTAPAQDYGFEAYTYHTFSQHLLDFKFLNVNFSGLDLTGTDFRGSDFTGANLSGVDLTKTRLRDANLSKANLSNARLNFELMINLNLTGADLTGAVWTYRDQFGLKNLTGKDVTGAELGPSADDLKVAIFCNTTMPDGSVNNSGC
jgi:hypothetical protein